MIELLAWPFVAGLVLAGIHAWFGLHVLARGVVFVDLSLAQVAALGLTVAILLGHDAASEAGYWYALAFALGGAVLFALSRAARANIQQEAIIGIVYAVSASLGVLALDRAPQGAEHIKQLMIGSILTVSPEEIATITALYLVIAVVHVVFRRALVEVSFDPHAASARGHRWLAWDIVFYGSFALVVTSSVRVAGVLLVFAYLIVPASLAGLLVEGLARRLVVAWLLGAALTAAGLGAAWGWDLPTGPAIVSAFGAAIALAGIVFAMKRMTVRLLGQLTAVAAAVVGALLLAFPRMDQPWLDALEGIAPLVQTVVLSEFERTTRRETLQDIERARVELTRLRALEQDVRWGRVQMDPEKAERLRQYLAGRGEISAGDELVLRSLRAAARERQRWMLGLPLLLIGVGGLCWLAARPMPARSAEQPTQ